jgi:hypothetical protein
MALSETVLAAMIGASATLGAAVFQLARARSSGDPRPRRSRWRSTIAMLALMTASAIGGFAYSEYRSLDTEEELQALRTELRRDLAALSTSTARIEQLERRRSDAPRPRVAAASPVATESIVLLPPCLAPAADAAPVATSLEVTGGIEALTVVETPPRVCEDAARVTVTLCAAVPAGAELVSVARYAGLPDDAATWQPFDVAAPADSTGVTFEGASLSTDPAAASVPVCERVTNADPANARLARLVVTYRSAPLPVPAQGALAQR